MPASLPAPKSHDDIAERFALTTSIDRSKNAGIWGGRSSVLKPYLFNLKVPKPFQRINSFTVFGPPARLGWAYKSIVEKPTLPVQEHAYVG
jgi:hypothetical protein